MRSTTPLLLLFGVFCTTLSLHAQKTGSDTTLLALSLFRSDDITHTTSQAILLIGGVYNGRFFPVEEPDSQEEPSPSNSLRATLLKRFSSFSAYWRGQSLGTGRVATTEIAAIQCSRLVVGIPTKSLTAPEYTEAVPMTGASGFQDGKEVSYNMTFPLALLSRRQKSFDQKHAGPVTYSISDSALLAAQSILRAESRFPSISDSAFSVTNFRALDLDADSRPEYVLCLHADTDSSCESFAFILRLTHGKTELLLELSETNQLDSWGRGYDFLDVIDIDSDQVPEIVFTVGYYEATGFKVFKLRRGKLVQVLDTVVWGC